MERIKTMLGGNPKALHDGEYEPLNDAFTDDSGTIEGSVYEDYEQEGEDAPFSWIEYAIFALIGVAMLWAWYVAVYDLEGRELGLTCLSGTCSLPQHRTFRYASRATSGYCRTSSRQSHQSRR